MFIQTAQTPNPATLKFLPGQNILPAGSSGAYDFANVSEAKPSPLAQRLFAIAGVDRVFLGSDFVSVSKDDTTDWSMLKPMVLAALMEHIATGQPVLLDGAMDDSLAILDSDDPIVAQIKELLAERVRPAVMNDGGDITFESFEEKTGVVYLRMRGACAGCPSSTATLKMGIENMLRHFIPEIQEVRAAPDFDDFG